MIKSKNTKSCLIVGQGIAGSVLAWTLLKSGHNVILVDENHHESSSMVSAGIINAITGQRLVFNTDFDMFSVVAKKLYSQISAELGNEYFISKPIIRVLRSDEEIKRCHHLNSSPLIQPYIQSINPSGYFGTALHDPFGTITITQGGYFQSQQLLLGLKQYLLNKKILYTERFSYADVKLNNHYPRWRSHAFDAVIFCEGFKAKLNPWFKDLNYNFAKGEMLKVKILNSHLPDAIICQQQWCIPALDNTYLVGSTYDRLNINTQSTPAGQEMILKGLNDFINSGINVIESYAGVRPVMLNQKPIVGMHPSLPRLGIFNGFGSKGFLCTPYYAQILKQHIELLT